MHLVIKDILRRCHLGDLGKDYFICILAGVLSRMVIRGLAMKKLFHLTDFVPLSLKKPLDMHLLNFVYPTSQTSWPLRIC